MAAPGNEHVGISDQSNMQPRKTDTVDSCSTNAQPILGLGRHEKPGGGETGLEGIESKSTQHCEVTPSQVPSRNPNQIKLAASTA